MKTVFFGTADFGIPALQALIDDNHEVVAVVTNPPRPAGRGRKLRQTPIATYCQKEGIAPVLTPEDLTQDEFLATLRSLNADLFIVVAFSILPPQLFTIPPLGTYNIHAALLPAFRGPAPIQRAIEAGARTTGVTLFRIDAQVDTGSIVHQQSLTIGENETTPELYERLSNLGGIVLREGITYISDPDYELTAQDHSLATKAPLLHKSEGHINWHDTATIIARRVRAFKPFPGTFTYFGEKRLGVEKAEVVSIDSSQEPGVIVQCSGGKLIIACGQDALSLLEVKPEGKRNMSVADYLNGSALVEGSKVL